MIQIKQKDLKKGMIVSDVCCTEMGDLFEVIEECTDTQSLGLKLLTDDYFYKYAKDEGGLNRFGKFMLYGDINWYIPTQEEIELIKNRDK